MNSMGALVNVSNPTNSLEALANYSDQNRTKIVALNDQRASDLIPVMTFIALLLLVGVVGNVLVVIIFPFRMRMSTQNFLIVTLAVFDLLSCFISMPFEIVDLRYSLFFTVRSLCRVMRFTGSFCTFSSICTLIVIAVDRYLKICRPLKRQMSLGNAKMALVAVTFVSLMYSLPAVLVYGTRSTYLKDSRVVSSDCSTDDSVKDTPYPLMYNLALFLTFIIIFIFVSVIYIRIWREMKRHSKYMSRAATITNASSHYPTLTTREMSSHLDSFSRGTVSKGYSLTEFLKGQGRARLGESTSEAECSRIREFSGFYSKSNPTIIEEETVKAISGGEHSLSDSVEFVGTTISSALGPIPSSLESVNSWSVSNRETDTTTLASRGTETSLTPGVTGQYSSSWALKASSKALTGPLPSASVHFEGHSTTPNTLPKENRKRFHSWKSGLVEMPISGILLDNLKASNSTWTIGEFEKGKRLLKGSESDPAHLCLETKTSVPGLIMDSGRQSHTALKTAFSTKSKTNLGQSGTGADAKDSPVTLDKPGQSGSLAVLETKESVTVKGSQQYLKGVDYGPNSVEVKTEGVKSRPSSVEMKTEGVKSGPSSFEVKTERVKSGPSFGEVKTERVKTGPSSVEVKTEGVKSGPSSVEVKTERVKSGPSFGEVKTESVKSRPSSVEVKIEEVKSGPSSVEVKTERVKTGPSFGEVKIERVKSGPSYVEVKIEGVKSGPSSVEVQPERVKSGPNSVDVKTERVKNGPSSIDVKTKRVKSRPSTVEIKTKRRVCADNSVERVGSSSPHDQTFLGETADMRSEREQTTFNKGEEDVFRDRDSPSPSPPTETVCCHNDSPSTIPNGVSHHKDRPSSIPKDASDHRISPSPIPNGVSHHKDWPSSIPKDASDHRASPSPIPNGDAPCHKDSPSQIPPCRTPSAPTERDSSNKDDIMDCDAAAGHGLSKGGMSSGSSLRNPSLFGKWAPCAKSSSSRTRDQSVQFRKRFGEGSAGRDSASRSVAIKRSPAVRTYKATLVALSITVVFFLSFVPNLSLITARIMLDDFDKTLEGPALVFYNIFLRTYFINSMSNPIIYGVLNVRFRKECVRLFRCRFTCKKQTALSSESSRGL